MTRFEKEIRKQGFKLANDYEYLPCGDIDNVWTRPDKAECYYYHYGMGVITYRFNRDMSFDTIYED